MINGRVKWNGLILLTLLTDCYWQYFCLQISLLLLAFLFLDSLRHILFEMVSVIKVYFRGFFDCRLTVARPLHVYLRLHRIRKQHEQNLLACRQERHVGKLYNACYLEAVLTLWPFDLHRVYS